MGMEAHIDMISLEGHHQWNLPVLQPPHGVCHITGLGDIPAIHVSQATHDQLRTSGLQVRQAAHIQHWLITLCR